MSRFLLHSLTILCLLVWGAAAILIKAVAVPTIDVIPTLLVIPSATPTQTWMPTPTTLPPTPTVLPTETSVPTLTPTLAVRVLEITASMLETSVPADRLVTDIPASLPPLPIEPLPDATHSAPPFMGWFRFESDYPNMHYVTAWTRHLDPFASRGQYHQASMNGTARFVFEGEALRLRYHTGPEGGHFTIAIDGLQVATLNGQAGSPTFVTSPIYAFNPGSHWLELNTTEGKLSLDAIDVFRSSIASPSIVVSTPTATVTPRVISDIELISAPATVQPTLTPVPPRILMASVVIAYDENGNRVIDPAEGVSGISVRVVDVTTNRVIESGLTDRAGYVRFERVVDAPTRIVVPYFGKSWDWTEDRGGVSTFTLLLTPGNQPGLIP